MKLNALVNKLMRRLCEVQKRTRKGRQRSTRQLLIEKVEDRCLLASINLATLNAAQGATIFGLDAGDTSGYVVSSAGDMNGDGYDDMIIGARFADGLGNTKDNAGETYVLFGSPLLASTIDLANLGSAGITIFGMDVGDYSGSSVSGGGDINGDGFDDLIVGAESADAIGNSKSQAGESYIIFGNSSLPNNISLSNLGSAGITIFGAKSANASGAYLGRAGDVNRDGFDDLLIAAVIANGDGNLRARSGETYLIFGAESLPLTIDLSNLGLTGITIFGADANDESGRYASSAGDFNGDGYDDIIIGANLADGPGNSKDLAGETYVIFGGPSLPTNIDLANLGLTGITIFGADTKDQSGIAVNSAGDVNGDGFDDLIIGAFWADAFANLRSDAGESYVIYGRSSPPTSIDLANLGSAGITIYGVESFDRSGISVSGGGDINGDGFDDLLIGAYTGSPAIAGESYVVFGGSSLPSSIDLVNLGSNGVTVVGIDLVDFSGWFVNEAGDINGDGFGDFLIGARLADSVGNSRTDAGESYLIYGSNGFTSSVAHLGTSASETLTGSSANNIMNGGRGNDTIIGNGGADVLTGGQENDILAVSDMTFRRIIGGTGSDTLRLDGSGQVLNLIYLPDNRILGIERIDITGTGANTVVLNQREVLNISDESNTLRIDGNTGDTVSLAGPWSQELDEIFGNVPYRVYKSGNATLKIQNLITLVTTPKIEFSMFSAPQLTSILGAESNDWSGYSVSTAGDVNGDGFDDLIIGAPYADGVGNAKSAAGDSYVIFGGPTTATTIDLASLGSAGMTIFGADNGDQSGISVSSAGDLNGDGFDDLTIGAWQADALGNAKAAAGDSYIIYGGSSLPGTVDLANLGTAGITFFGSDSNDRSGVSIRGAGDVNGDGFEDVIIGAFLGDAANNSKSDAGESYLVFGGLSLPSTLDLSSLGTAGVTIFGVDPSDQSGFSVSSGGDVNGDGFDDLIIGARTADAQTNLKSDAGESYVIFGGSSLPTTIDLFNPPFRTTFIFGAEANDQSGRAVSSAGDVNGDGFDDLLIGAYNADALSNAKNGAGDSYVVFGSAVPPQGINLLSLGSAGITIFGADAGDGSGRSLSRAGDVNGDGFDDLIVGASGADALGNSKNLAGDSYLIYGGSSPPTTIDLAVSGSWGFTIFGAEAGDRSGISVSNAGDINGDGFGDVVIGAFLADAANNLKTDAGESYVVLGENFTSAVTHLGTSANDTLTGSLSANVMNGARGNDTLVGNGGADVLTGGQGNDTLAVSDLAFRRIVGGNGFDTLRLDGSSLSLNLTTIRDNRILGIEQIDITGTGINTLTLSYLEVLNVSDESNTLIVRRDIGDVVNIGTGWSQAQKESIGNELFDVFTQGQAVLKLRSFTPTITVTSGTKVYNNAAYLPVGTIVGNAPLPPLSFSYFSDVAGTIPISAPENVGTYYVRASSPANASNLAAQSTITQFQITPFGLSSNATAANRMYNSTTAASVSVNLSGVFIGDVVSATASGTFGNKNAGVGKTVSVGSITLAGPDANNYTVSAPTSPSADITPFALTGSITAANKTYDGTVAATILTRTLANVFSGDSVSYVGGTASFSDSSVGVGKLVTAIGLTLSGVDSPNYSVNSSATTTANIQNDGLATITNVQVFYKNSGFTGVPAALDSNKTLLRSTTTTQVTSFANVINYSRGINGLVLDVAGLAAASLSASDFIFRVAPAGASGAVDPNTWLAAPTPTLIDVTTGNATTAARVRLEWADEAIMNTWLQIIVKANANTGLINREVFYLGHAYGEVDGVAPYRLSTIDVGLVRAAVGNAIVSVNDVRDFDKDRRITTTDVGLMRARVNNNVLLNNITIPAAGSSGEGEGRFAPFGNSDLFAPPIPIGSSDKTLGGNNSLGRSESATLQPRILPRWTGLDYSVTMANWHTDPMAKRLEVAALQMVETIETEPATSQIGLIDAFFTKLEKKRLKSCSFDSPFEV
jgi:hypothetical protein